MTTQPAGLASLFTALTVAAQEAGVTLPQMPEETRKWEKAGHWSHPSFGSFEIGVYGFETQDSGFDRDASWARVNLHGKKPQNLKVDFGAKTVPGITLFQCRFDIGGAVTFEKVDDLSNISPLEVPIDWIDSRTQQPSNRPDAVPSTQRKGRNDTAFILMDSVGRFIQIEVSVKPINGSLWVAVQEMYFGQVVTTTQTIARSIDLNYHKDGNRTAFVVPLSPEGAYPGFDYIKSFGVDAIKAALSIGASSRLHEVPVAKWEDPPYVIPVELEQKGYKRGVVDYFNISAGYGFLTLEDGQKCFVHFKDIKGDGGSPVASAGQFPFLHGQEVAAVKWQQGNQGPKATAVRRESISKGGLIPV